MYHLHHLHANCIVPFAIANWNSNTKNRTLFQQGKQGPVGRHLEVGALIDLVLYFVCRG